MTHKRLLTSLVALLCWTTTATAQSSDAIKAFKKDFKPSGKVLDKAMQGTESYRTDHPVYVEKLAEYDKLAESWKSLADGLAGEDSPAIAKLVADAWVTVDKEVAALIKEREKLEDRVDKAYEKIAKLTKGEGVIPGREYPNSVASAEQVFLMASRRSSEVRRSITHLTTLHESLREVASKFRDATTLTWMLENLIGSKKYALALKVEAIRAAGVKGELMLAPLLAALDKADKADEVAALVYGVGLLGEQAKVATPKLIELMRHDDSGVRESAAQALKYMKAPESIEPMIELLGIERGHARQRIANALEILTGQQHGLDVAVWRRWFVAEGADYAAGKKPLGEGKASAHEEFNKKNYYYGIPQDGAGIVYIIDCSGSMVLDKDNPEFEPNAQRPDNPRPVAAKDPQNSRSSASKRELIRALGQLSSDKTFNIVWYSHGAEQFEKKMTPATPANIERATKWVEKLPAYSSTNIYDALKLAFEITGRGSFDATYAVEFDQIFLMTDGKPTLQAIGDDDPRKIIEGARQWNSLKRVQIHTIAFGLKDIEHEFMRDLAAENRGVYRIVTPEGVKTYEEIQGKIEK